MAKTPITWIELIKKHINAKGPGTKLGDVTDEASAEWKDIKAGTHSKYSQKSSAGTPRKKGKGTRKAKKGRHPRKGDASLTRPGKKDFRTHKGDKLYNRKGHRQTKNLKGVKGRPFVGDKGYSAKDVLDQCKLCIECANKVQDLIGDKKGGNQTINTHPLSPGATPAHKKTQHHQQRAPILGGAKPKLIKNKHRFLAGGTRKKRRGGRRKTSRK